MSARKQIQLSPIGYVRRDGPDEDVKDRSIVSRVVLDAEFAEGLIGIEEFSHVYIIFWLNEFETATIKLKGHIYGKPEQPFVGVFATRSPIRPNFIGQSLVELIKCEGNVMWVRGLDANDGTPVLDIKPYPDWERGKWIVVREFSAPEWLQRINK